MYPHLCRLQEIIITIFEDRDYIKELHNRLMFIKTMVGNS